MQTRTGLLRELEQRGRENTALQSQLDAALTAGSEGGGGADADSEVAQQYMRSTRPLS